MIECTMPYIPICIGIAAILFIIAIFKESFKNAVIAVIVLLSIPVYLIMDSDTIEQCKIQQNKQRIENDKQYLLDNLEQGQCGDVCLKETNSVHSTRYEHYTMCEVSIKVCKE